MGRGAGWKGGSSGCTTEEEKEEEKEEEEEMKSGRRGVVCHLIQGESHTLIRRHWRSILTEVVNMAEGRYEYNDNNDDNENRTSRL